MGLLDKLKPQPRWKHADPAIRLEALKELDDAVELGVLAETDPDVRVRRGAVARLSSPDILGRIAGQDSDEETRDRAADRLVVLASRSDKTGAPDAETDALAVSAVRELRDPRRLSTIAKSDVPEAVSVEALARITDARALSSIARQAKREPIALLALSRLSDPSELTEIALHATSADVAVGAFDRLTAQTSDVASLRSIEGHT